MLKRLSLPALGLALIPTSTSIADHPKPEIYQPATTIAEIHKPVDCEMETPFQLKVQPILDESEMRQCELDKYTNDLFELAGYSDSEKGAFDSLSRDARWIIMNTTFRKFRAQKTTFIDGGTPKNEAHDYALYAMKTYGLEILEDHLRKKMIRERDSRKQIPTSSGQQIFASQALADSQR